MSKPLMSRHICSGLQVSRRGKGTLWKIQEVWRYRATQMPSERTFAKVGYHWSKLKPKPEFHPNVEFCPMVTPQKSNIVHKR